MVFNTLKPGDIITDILEKGSIYMVIRTEKRNVFCIGTDSKGLLETNDDDFVNLELFSFGPPESILYFKRLNNISYESGSYLDYLNKVIVEKSMKILSIPEDRRMYINIIQENKNIWIDPTKNTYEEYYKDFFKEL